MLDVEGGSLAYEEAGRGLPIVLMHEGIADSRVWDREFSLLAQDHHVVRYDLRGFGRSPSAKGPYSDVRDLKALVDHLQLRRPTLVAPSMSGRIAIDYALAYPDSVSGLLLIAPGISGLQPEMVPEGKAALEVDDRLSQAATKAWSDGDLPVATEHLRTLWCAALKGDALELFRTMVKENAIEVFDSRSEKLEDSKVPPAATRLSSMKVPTDVLVGDEDNPFSFYIADFVAKNIPGARLTRVPGGDHLLNLSRPDAFDHGLSNLLARSSGRL